MKKLYLPLIIIVVLILIIASLQPAQAQTASWYGGKFHGRTTASGEIFNKWGMTAASNSHKMGTCLKVTNVANGKSVVVKVNDTGGFAKYGRTLDLSQGAFSKISNIDKGVIKIKIKILR